MTRLKASLQGIGLLGPGLNEWPAARAVLRGEAPYQPAATILPPPAVLPPAERRRAGRIIKLALAIGAQAVAQADMQARALPTVFSSAGGDGENCHEICMALAGSDRRISPTRFHNSVHNAAAGYWSIAYGCAEPSTALCAHDASFGAGLLEAAMLLAGGQEAVLLVAYDIDYPMPLGGSRPIPDAFGIALALAASPSRHSLATFKLELHGGPATPLDDPQLEQLRRAIPAARGLPLLECVARARTSAVVLDYLENTRLRLTVSASA